MIERYLYDPYGERSVLDADWTADADGVSDIAFVHGHQGETKLRVRTGSARRTSRMRSKSWRGSRRNDVLPPSTRTFRFVSVASVLSMAMFASLGGINAGEHGATTQPAPLEHGLTGDGAVVMRHPETGEAPFFSITLRADAGRHHDAMVEPAVVIWHDGTVLILREEDRTWLGLPRDATDALASDLKRIADANIPSLGRTSYRSPHAPYFELAVSVDNEQHLLRSVEPISPSRHSDVTGRAGLLAPKASGLPIEKLRFLNAWAELLVRVQRDVYELLADEKK